nr:hypothetical protein [Tanacetum cinerariifolium]
NNFMVLQLCEETMDKWKERRMDYGDWFDGIYAEKNGAYLVHERIAHNEAEKKGM